MVRISNPEVQQFEKDHTNRVRKAGADGTLFLKRNGDFPLSKADKIALFGVGARRTVKGGTGSGDVNVRKYVTVEEGLENAGFEIVSKPWIDSLEKIMTDARNAFTKGIRDKAEAEGKSGIFIGISSTMEEPSYSIAIEGESDTCVYVLARSSGEGKDRQMKGGDILLTDDEIRDISICHEKYERFMLVLNVGGVVDLTPVLFVENILLLGQLGIATGDILADIVLGKSNPSGKLTATWAPIDLYKSTEGFGDKDETEYKDDIYVGYRYFSTNDIKPTFAFGHGLSYTDFSIKDVMVSKTEDEITASATVVNTGKYAGREVVQVYASVPSVKLDQPALRLVGFAKTKMLSVGESEKIELQISYRNLASFDEAADSFVLEAGEYVFRIGNSSDNTVVAGCLSIDHVDLGKDVITRSEKLSSYADRLAGFTDEELALLCCGNFERATDKNSSAIGSAGVHVAGTAGETSGHLIHKGVEQLYMADGPAGLRISKTYQALGDKVFGGDGGLAVFLEYMTEWEKKLAAAKMDNLTEEEKNAPEYYQYCTAIPIGTAIAQSLDEHVAEDMVDLVGEEMEMFGIHLWLAPALNIHRSPLCGRNFEYFSEDPMISGKMAAGITRGVQSHKNCGVTIKHFACNNQETNRFVSNSVVSNRAMREIYLRGFEIAVRESAPAAIMTSYNLINGEHSCSNKWLLTDVLRNEWGYDGLVMTDWNVTGGFGNGAEKRDNKYPIASSAGCIKAGNNLIMPGGEYDIEDILSGLNDENHPYHITRDDLLANAAEVLSCIEKLK